MIKSHVKILLILVTYLFSSTSFADEKTKAIPETCFPESISGFVKTSFSPEQIEALKANRNSIAAGYNTKENNLAITVFIYDRENHDEDAYEQEINLSFQEIFAAYKNSELVMNGGSTLPLSGVEVESYGGLFLWTLESKDYASFLWLVMQDKHFIKVRATYIRPKDDEKTPDAMKLAIDSVKKITAKMCTPE